MKQSTKDPPANGTPETKEFDDMTERFSERFRAMRLDDLEDVKTWIAEHDGRISAWWEHQHSWNDKIESRAGRIEARLSSMERKVVWLSGFAAAAGSGIGAVLSNVLGA